MRISRIDVTFDLDSLERRVQVWRISTTSTHVARGARVLDVQGAGILSARFDSGKDVWIALEAGVDGLALTRKVIEEAKDDSLRAEKVELGRVDRFVLLQLLMNSLSASHCRSIRYSNVSGHLYAVSPVHVKTRNGKAMQVHAVEVVVDAQGCLHLPVRTFTSLALKKYMARTKVDPEALPRYVLTKSQQVVRSFETEVGQLVMRQVANRKYRIPFLDARGKDAFSQSKLGMLSDVLADFEALWGDACSIRFEELDEVVRISDVRYVATRWKAEVRSMLAGEAIAVVNQTGDESYDDVCRSLALALGDYCNAECRSGADVADGELLVRVIHERDEYAADPGRDPYDGRSPDRAIQHVSVEALCSRGGISRPIVDTVAKELAIKRDVVRRRMGVVDWAKTGLSGPWTFARILPDDEGEDAYAFVTVGEDGALDFAYESWDPMGESPHAALIDAMSLTRSARAAVQSPEGDINVILDTGLFGVPGFDEIREALEGDAGKVSRSREAIDGYFREATDIAFATIDEKSGYYYAGVVGSGMQATIPTAAILRKVVAMPGSSLFFLTILHLADVDFVRTKALTVEPFPLKHLTEWGASVGLPMGH